MRQVALGAAALHARGIVHGDICPQNVWIDQAGNGRLLQLPLSRSPHLPPTSPIEQTLTDEERARAADYAAPELGFADQTPDVLCDIYAIGCATYQLLAGHAPFAGESADGGVAEKLKRHATEAIQPLEPFGVPAELAKVVAFAMAKDRMEQPDAEHGFLLDGFPRNVSQAEALDVTLRDESMNLDAVLDLEVPEEEVVKRIAGRRICRNDSAHVFHVTYKQPKQEGVCDTCGGELYQRDDDSEETVRKRLEVYHTQTEPIIDYYKAQGLVVTISALGPVEEVTQRAMEALKREDDDQ